MWRVATAPAAFQLGISLCLIEPPGIFLQKGKEKMDFKYQEEQAVAPERDIVPAGVHEMEIRHAEEGPNSWKTSEDNPDGMCLKLRLATGNYRFVFDDLPQHLGWRAKQLADAIGDPSEGSSISLDPDDLIGRTIRVEISHYTSKVGKLSAVVKKYLPAKAKAVAKATKPRVTAVQVANAMSDDDIPF